MSFVIAARIVIAEPDVVWRGISCNYLRPHASLCEALGDNQSLRSPGYDFRHTTYKRYSINYAKFYHL